MGEAFEYYATRQIRTSVMPARIPPNAPARRTPPTLNGRRCGRFSVRRHRRRRWVLLRRGRTRRWADHRGHNVWQRRASPAHRWLRGRRRRGRKRRGGRSDHSLASDRMGAREPSGGRRLPSRSGPAPRAVPCAHRGGVLVEDGDRIVAGELRRRPRPPWLARNRSEGCVGHRLAGQRRRVSCGAGNPGRLPLEA